MARKKRRQPLLGSHQRCWLWGRNLVRETLAAGRWPIYELHLSDRLRPDELQQVFEAANQQGIEAVVESPARLRELSHSQNHQGYLAKVGPYPYVSPHDVLTDDVETPLFVVLDSLQDSYNFGAIIRCAEVFAASAVIVGNRQQAEVNSLVARSSAGAVNRIAITRTDDLCQFVRQLQERGVEIIGAREDAAVLIHESELSGPVAIVIGNEGQGISPEIRAVCDSFAAIPQQGDIGSLNAAVSAGIALYEARRQRSHLQ